MRRFILLAAIILAMLTSLLAGAGFYLSDSGLFHPGDTLFPVQNSLESLRGRLTSSATGKALYHLRLTEQRDRDLVTLAGTPSEVAALEAVSSALDRVLVAVSRVDNSDAATLRARLGQLVLQIRSDFQLLQVAPTRAPALYASVDAKITSVLVLMGNPGSETTQVEATATPPANLMLLPLLMGSGSPGSPAGTGSAGDINPLAVLFPPGSAGAQHSFYPLSGKHAQVGCESCHSQGQYAGTPTQCAACHAQDTPANHYQASCEYCHNSSDWSQVVFDHSAVNAVNCSTCHSLDKPSNHYPGQCSACHSTRGWRPANFSHQAAGATDCQSCHSRPANHYSGQCSSCHNTSAWRQASFNHQAAGATDCQSCHTRPSNHYSGQCSSCHNTNAWQPANFNHTSTADCQSCHSRPASHYSGQCSSCHSTSAWSPANFSHQAAGATDCQSCHSRPANHYAGQCSSCHSTSAWSPANFDHQATGATDCQSCHTRPSNHYSGQCSNCHSIGGWQQVSFSHQGYTDCQSCHNPPGGHWAGQCSKCHDTSNWGNIRVASHSFPMGHGDAGGQCSRCHSGSNTSVNCYVCHDRAKMEEKHAEKGIMNIAGQCLACHPTGNKD